MASRGGNQTEVSTDHLMPLTHNRRDEGEGVALSTEAYRADFVGRFQYRFSPFSDHYSIVAAFALEKVKEALTEAAIIARYERERCCANIANKPESHCESFEVASEQIARRIEEFRDGDA